MENKIEMCNLGKTDIIVPVMGVGTMTMMPNKSLTEEDIIKTYSTCVDIGLNFFDTAEIYGNGISELALGKFIKKDGRPVILASKFAPPSSMNPLTQKRTTVSKDDPRALLEALDGSLARLGVDHLDLYQIHMVPKKTSITEYMDVMAEAVRAGKVRAVGVCNFSPKQMKEASDALAKHGIPLATNMVGYNILRRWPETNGVFDMCKELGISIIPYAPLAEGILTGKYRSGEKKIGMGYKAATYFGHLNITKERTDSKSFMARIFSTPRELKREKIEPLFEVMDEIARSHDKTLAQVAINWLITTENINVIPIPGMKNIKQVTDNAGAVDWKLSKEERDLIDKAEKATRS